MIKLVSKCPWIVKSVLDQEPLNEWTEHSKLSQYKVGVIHKYSKIHRIAILSRDLSVGSLLLGIFHSVISNKAKT